MTKPDPLEEIQARCRCLIHCAVTDEQRQIAQQDLKYARTVGDNNLMIINIGRLSGACVQLGKAARKGEAS